MSHSSFFLCFLLGKSILNLYRIVAAERFQHAGFFKKIGFDPQNCKDKNILSSGFKSIVENEDDIGRHKQIVENLEDIEKHKAHS